MAQSKINAFRRLVWRYYRAHGRHDLPRRFPTAKKLAATPLSEVLKAWQGLGYNRRAKQLRAAAQALATKKSRTVEELEKLPGVGPYTAQFFVCLRQKIHSKARPC